jgi:hypothetical protein
METDIFSPLNAYFMYFVQKIHGWLVSLRVVAELTHLLLICHRYVRGCLQSCDDADACNKAPTSQTCLGLLVLCSITLMGR